MTTTLNLREGDRVHFPATLNSRGFCGTVVSVEPWILSAGPHAGEQARQGRGDKSLLWTVILTDVETFGTTTGPSGDIFAEDETERRMSVRADHEWEVVGPDPDAAREEEQIRRRD